MAKVKDAALEGDKNILIISNANSNLEALEAILNDANGSFSDVLVLGNLIGAGPSPNEVIEKMAELEKNLNSKGGKVRILTGDYEKALLAGEEGFEYISRLMSKEELAFSNFLKKEIKPENYSWLFSKCVESNDFATELDNESFYASFAGPPEIEKAFFPFSTSASQIALAIRQNIIFLGKTGFFSVSSAKKDEKRIIQAGSADGRGDLEQKASYILYNPEKKQFLAGKVSFNVASLQKKMINLIQKGLKPGVVRNLVGNLKTGTT